MKNTLTAKQALNYNILISNFLGIKTYEEASLLTGIDNYYLVDENRNQIRFCSSWDWLMSAVDEIEAMGFILTIDRAGNTHRAYFNHADTLAEIANGARDENRFDTILLTVIDFIEYHNKNITNI